MNPFRSQSTSDQLADHLRKEILSGRLHGAMPGIQQIVKSLGVNSVAVSKAVQQLEREGLIISQGRRRQRLISPDAQAPNSSVRIGFLHYDAQNELRHDSLLVRQALVDAGHTAVMAPKTMSDLGMNPERIKKMVMEIDADAWAVYAGSKELLDWFTEYEKPAFAVYGRFISTNLPGIGIRKDDADGMALDRLVSLGHKRIVLIVREERRKPNYGRAEHLFLDRLQSHGIQTGAYNIPDWEETPEGLAHCLDKLLEHTPPTALVICDPVLFHAVQIHLAHRGYKTPDDISLYCDDYAESFEWTQPSIAHLQWDHRPIIRRVLQWAKNLSLGREDLKQNFTKAKFIDGDSIGPIPKP